MKEDAILIWPVGRSCRKGRCMITCSGTRALPPALMPGGLNRYATASSASINRFLTCRTSSPRRTTRDRAATHTTLPCVVQLRTVQLVAAELIFKRGTPPDAEYTFKHALVQDAAYSTLLRSRRQQIHGRIATTLESQFPETMTSQPELLAHHCGEAGLTEKAVGYWLKAGQQAVARSAMTEAVAQLRRGLALLASMPDGADHEQRELELQAALVPAVMAAKGYTAPEVGETIVRARSLAEKLDRTDSLIGLDYGEMVYRLVRGELKLTLSLAKSVEQIGVARNNRAAQLMGRHWLQGVTHYFLGDFVTARALLEDCEGLQDPVHRAVYATMTANDPYASTLAYLGMTLTVLGYIDQGRRRANAAVSEARLLRSQHSLAEVLTFAGWTERHCGSSRTAQQHAEEVVALSSEHGLPFWVELGTVLLGWSSAALGDARHGLDLIKEGMSLFAATDGAKLPYASALTNLAECYGALGHAADGISCLNEAAQIIDTMSHRVWEVDVFRVRGDLLSATGDRTAAKESYHRALAAARSQTAKTLELRVATSLARLWRDEGKRAEAREALATVYGWFTEGFNTPVLQEAKALLDELAA
jgi:tetratricopeptide (TPR) repeat protein